MSNPNIPSSQPYEHDSAEPEAFWTKPTRRRVGALALMVAAMATLGSRMYAEGARMAEERGDTYSIGQFYKDTSHTRMRPQTRNGQKLYERTFVVGKDGSWRAGEQGVNNLLGAGVAAGAFAVFKRTKRTDKKQANS